MLKKIIFAIVLNSTILMSFNAFAEPITVKDKDTIEAVLKSQMGKRVSIKTESGELSGTVTQVGKHLTHLGALTGKEYYDAVIVNQKIEAVIIRTK